MSRRIDYYDDPAAPKANSLVPSVNVVVVNDAGDVLMIRRSDNGNWAVPGGAIDLGESMVQAAVRETREETGIECEITGLVGIYTDPKHVILYTSNGEVRQEFSILLTGVATGGQPTPSSESQRGAVGAARGSRRLSDGPVDAAADRALPGWPQRLAVSGMSWCRASLLGCGQGLLAWTWPTASRISGVARRIDRLTR